MKELFNVSGMNQQKEEIKRIFTKRLSLRSGGVFFYLMGVLVFVKKERK